MRILQCMRVLPLVCAIAAGGCDNDDDPEPDRSTTILGLSGDSAAGATAFAGNCGTTVCHGPDGAGGTDAPAPPMDLATRVPALSDAAIVTILLDGTDAMPSQASRSDQELADVLAYLNEEFAN